MLNGSEPDTVSRRSLVKGAATLAGGVTANALLPAMSRDGQLAGLTRTSRMVPVTQAERKAAQNAAPVYMYLFSWQTPVLDGRPRAFHGSELAFVFYNTDRCAHMTGGTDEARELAAKVSDAWINFARRGDPNHSGLPKWPVFEAEKGPVMVFDKKSEVHNDPDRDCDSYWSRHDRRRRRRPSCRSRR